MAVNTRSILLIDSIISNEMLIREILSQFSGRMSVRSLSDDRQFERHYITATRRVIPEIIIIGYHFPEPYAENIILMIRNDVAFRQSAVYIVGRNTYGSFGPGYWEEIGADGYIQWSDRPSELKRALWNVIRPKLKTAN